VNHHDNVSHRPESTFMFVIVIMHEYSGTRRPREFG
jgi:hypothetical protein